MAGLTAPNSALCVSWAAQSGEAVATAPALGFPSFIDQTDNAIEFADTRAMAGLLAGWRRAGPMVIAHFGDSHVQKGYEVAVERAVLQRQRGDAGRGMLFPYSIAHTYSQSDYTSSYTGDWHTANSIQQPPKLPVGIAGFVAMTADTSASFEIDFKTAPPPGKERIRLLYRATGERYQVRITMGDVAHTLTTEPATAGKTSIMDFDFPSAAQSISVLVNRPGGAPGEFELYGLSLENPGAPGLIDHDLGVGGAVFNALNEQTYFEDEMAAIQPDLVILDWGTNDIVFTNSVPAAFDATVREAIGRVRAAAPHASILLISSQDMVFRHHDITSAQALSEALRHIAFSEGCLFYDWYRVSGGRGMMDTWRASGLSLSDTIHLSAAGYNLKGQLFAQAILSTISFAEHQPRRKSLILGAPLSDPIDQLLREQSLAPAERRPPTLMNR